MRIYRSGNVEWDVNSATRPPCGCWFWAITPEMGEYQEIDGNSHHPRCPRLVALAERRAGGESD